jgi:hypothetical protein
VIALKLLYVIRAMRSIAAQRPSFISLREIERGGPLAVDDRMLLLPQADGGLLNTDEDF